MSPDDSENRVLGLDVGNVRTGIAISDELGWTARPLLTVQTDQLAKALPELLQKYGVQQIVVGRPRSLDGSLGNQTAKIAETVRWLESELPVKFVYEDETGTTQETGKGTDEEAACVMLQGYLDEAA